MSNDYQKTDADIHFAKGCEKEKIGDFSKAIYYYNITINLNPKYAIAYFRRGNLNVNNNDYYKAIKDYTKAININHYYSDAYSNRGYTHYMVSNYLEALKDCNKALEIYPKDIYAYIHRSFIKKKLNIEYADFDWQTAMDINSEYSSAHIIKIDAKTHLLDKKVALFIYNKINKPSTENPMIDIGNAYSKFQKGDFIGSIHECNNALSKMPSLNKSIIYRGKTVRFFEDYIDKIWLFDQDDEIMQNCNKAIQLNPKDAEAYNNRGILKIQSNAIEEAISDFNIAIELKPDYYEAYFNKGIIHFESNKYEAIKDFSNSIQFNPNFAEAYFYRGMLYFNISDNINAFYDMYKACALGIEQANELINKY